MASSVTSAGVSASTSPSTSTPCWRAWRVISVSFPSTRSEPLFAQLFGGDRQIEYVVLDLERAPRVDPVLVEGVDDLVVRAEQDGGRRG